MPSVRFSALVGGLAILCCGFQAIAGESPIVSCDQAPQLADIRAQFPGHVLESEATSPPRFKRVGNFNASRLIRDVGSLVCIVMAVDTTGKITDFKLMYPPSAMLTRQERKGIMSMKATPGEVDGTPTPSLSILSIID